MACTLPVTGSRLEIQVVPASLYTNFEYHLQVITISLLPVRLLSTSISITGSSTSTSIDLL